MADCCLIKKVATVEVYENKNEVRAYGFMAGDRNTPVMEVRFKHLWGESNLSSCKLRWIIVDDVGSLLVGEVPIQSDNTALINLPNELFTGDRRMKVQLTVASCDGERILNLQQFTDLKVINSLAPNEVVEPVYQILINALHDESQKYLKELETSYTQKYGSLDSLYKSARASLEQYLTTAENGGNAEFLQGYAPHNFKKTEDTIANLQASTKYKLGEVVELLGYYTAGDGAHHKRKIEATDDGSGVQLANGLWANIVHNGEVNVSWFGATEANFLGIIEKYTNDIMFVFDATLIVTNSLNINKMRKQTITLKGFATAHLPTGWNEKNRDDIIFRTSDGFGITYEGNTIYGNETKLVLDGVQMQFENDGTMIKIDQNGDQLPFLVVKNSILKHKKNGIIIDLGGANVKITNCQFLGEGELATGLRIVRDSTIVESCSFLYLKNCVELDKDENETFSTATSNFTNCFFQASTNNIYVRNVQYSFKNLHNYINCYFAEITHQNSSCLKVENVEGQVDLIDGLTFKFTDCFFLSPNASLNSSVFDLANKKLFIKLDNCSFNEQWGANDGCFLNYDKSLFDFNNTSITLEDYNIDAKRISNFSTEQKNLLQVKSIRDADLYDSNKDKKASSYFSFYLDSRTYGTIQQIPTKEQASNNMNLGFVSRRTNKPLLFLGYGADITHFQSCNYFESWKKGELEFDGNYGSVLFTNDTKEMLIYTPQGWVSYENFKGVFNSLNTPYHALKMQQEGVYEDFIEYMDSKTEYDRVQRYLETQRQETFEQRENQEQTYEEWLAQQPVFMPAEEEPQPSKALLDFKNRYIG